MTRRINASFCILLILYSITLVKGDGNSTSTNDDSPIKPVYAHVKQFKDFTAILKCTISTKDATGIGWERNGTKVKGDSRITVVKSSNETFRSTSLKIKSIEASDFGTYECHANISGNVSSASIKLTEKKKGSVVRPQETKVKQSLKSDASLKCLLPKHASSIDWLKNGTKVKTDKRHDVLRSSNNKFRSTTLVIKSIEADDFDTYECTANISGKIHLAKITLAEKKKTPAVKAARNQLKEPLKGNVILKCDFSKHPSSFSWSKDGKKVVSDDRHTIVKYDNSKKKTIAISLNIKKLETSDYGTYECEATISDKKHSASIKLEEKKS